MSRSKEDWVKLVHKIGAAAQAIGSSVEDLPGVVDQLVADRDAALRKVAILEATLQNREAMLADIKAWMAETLARDCPTMRPGAGEPT